MKNKKEKAYELINELKELSDLCAISVIIDDEMIHAFKGDGLELGGFLSFQSHILNSNIEKQVHNSDGLMPFVDVVSMKVEL
jgi:hypothetical protein